MSRDACDARGGPGRDAVSAVLTNRWVIIGAVALLAAIIVLMVLYSGGSGVGGGGY